MDPLGQPAHTMNVEGASTNAELSKYRSKGTTRLIAHITTDAFVIGKLKMDVLLNKINIK